MSTLSIPNAVERLLRGRLSPESITPLTEATPGLALAEAYDIQRNLEQAVVGQFADRGGAVDHRRFR